MLNATAQFILLPDICKELIVYDLPAPFVRHKFGSLAADKFDGVPQSVLLIHTFKSGTPTVFTD